MKANRKTSQQAAASLIQWAIGELMGNSTQRRKLGLSLYDLDQAAREGRKLLRQSRKS